MPTRDQLLDALSDLRRAKRKKRQSPYKPVVLLWAIGRMWRDPLGPRLLPFEATRAAVEPLLARFGRGEWSRPRPIDPLWRLQTDLDGAVWECRTTRPAIVNASGTPSQRELKAVGAMLGLSEAAHAMLLHDIPLRFEAAFVLAAQVCPPGLWEELFEAVGIPYEGSEGTLVVPVTTQRTREMVQRLWRDPAFRVAVLDAYHGRCAVCGTSPRLDGRRFGVEAAHIRWVTEEGPDAVANGLALCVMHHRGLDRGAFTLDESLRVKVSPRMTPADTEAAEQFWRFDGAPIALPNRAEHRPDEAFVAWHRATLFVAE
jgi:putative restriction endonuclease